MTSIPGFMKHTTMPNTDPPAAMIYGRYKNHGIPIFIPAKKSAKPLPAVGLLRYGSSFGSS